jgi:hypothetical protein
MNHVRFAHAATFALVATVLGCSAAEPEPAELGESAQPQKSAGYGFEFVTDRIAAQGALPASAPVSNDKIQGRLAPEMIRDVVRASFGPMKDCYTDALAAHRALEGEIAARLVIRQDGSVEGVTVERSTISDAAMTTCVTGVFGALKFPSSDGGIATVIYPVVFAPGPDNR